jgi:hypothetical protein
MPHSRGIFVKSNMKYLVSIFLGCLIILFAVSCGKQQGQGSVSTSNDSIAAMDDSAESCSQPIMDPNNPKPMALMMRQMAANADSMKQQIMRGEQLDSTRYPFIRFYLVEPTDPNVLGPPFYENARLFQNAYTALFQHPTEQVKYHNLVIQKCINCHEAYCSGPLKRIRKLIITN